MACEPGYRDLTRAIELSGWLSEVSSDNSLVVHEITSYATDGDAKK